MGIGTLVAIMFQFDFPFATEVPAIIPALGAALLAYLLGHWIEKVYEERKRWE